MTDEVCELVVTAPDADWLIEFTRRLVVERLAAGVHNLTPIRSIYEWEGRLYDRTESRAAIHTRASLVPRIIERLNREHPYDVPGVFSAADRPDECALPRVDPGADHGPMT